MAAATFDTPRKHWKASRRNRDTKTFASLTVKTAVLTILGQGMSLLLQLGVMLTRLFNFQSFRSDTARTQGNGLGRTHRETRLAGWRATSDGRIRGSRAKRRCQREPRGNKLDVG